MTPSQEKAPRKEIPLIDRIKISHEDDPVQVASTFLEQATGPSPERKKIFLSRLLSNGTCKYKRYIASPLRYAGGKSLAVGIILEYLPEDVTFLVSPFFGGGSVEIACARELGIQVQGYDLFDILSTYWKRQIDAPVKLACYLKRWKPTKDVYKQVKQRLKTHWDGMKLILDDTELAAHYWFNHNLSYGPGFLGWMSNMYEDTKRYHRLLEKVRLFRIPRLKVKKGVFNHTIPKHQKDFLYCDPPYYLDDDSKMFRGIYPQRNFPVHHLGFDHVALRNLLHTHKGGFILSYNDCKIIRDWYANFDIHEVSWQYTLGQGETRIGKNRIENGTRHYVKQSHELLIVGTKT